MENNVLEMLLKMMLPSPGQSQHAMTSYPQDGFPPSQTQNTQNVLPLILSMLSKSTNDVSPQNKNNVNKKAEVTSASDDEILL